MMIKHAVVFALPAFVLLPAQADFLGDAKGSLEARNFYMSRDFRDPGASQSKREEWAQGFILRLQSGYTEGTLGFGLDALGMVGYRLDSSPDRTGTGLLPKHQDGRAADEYSSWMPTAKLRLARSELLVGGLTPTLPLMAANFSRLLPQVFQGALLTSKDVDHLTVTAGRVRQVKLRDSADFQDMTITGMQGSFAAAAASDRMDYLGLDFTPLTDLTLSLHHAELEDIYRRGFAGLQYTLPVGPGKAFAELRYFDSRDAGRALAGRIDSRTLSTNFGYRWAGHTLSAGYQQVKGDTAFAYLAGSDTYLFSEMLVSTFAFKDERSHYVRYDHDFAAEGVPGLIFSLRYVQGDDVDPGPLSGAKAAGLRRAGQSGEEWERATDIGYVVQSGPLKDLSLRWRNSTYRSSYTDGADENRVIVSYQYKF